MQGGFRFTVAWNIYNRTISPKVIAIHLWSVNDTVLGLFCTHVSRTERAGWDIFEKAIPAISENIAVHETGGRYLYQRYKYTLNNK